MFSLDPKGGRSFTFFRDIWANKFLFFAVVIPMLSVFPAVYIPTLNDKVFRHKEITWEVSLAFASVPVFVAMCEIWKMAKRRFKLFELKAEPRAQVLLEKGELAV